MCLVIFSNIFVIAVALRILFLSLITEEVNNFTWLHYINCRLLWCIALEKIQLRKYVYMHNIKTCFKKKLIQLMESMIFLSSGEAAQMAFAFES